MDEESAEIWEVFVRAYDGPMGFYQTFWLQGDHFGEAAKRAYEILEESGAQDATIVDYAWSGPADDAIVIIPGAHIETVRDCWSREPFETHFQLPHGVVPYFDDHTFDLDDLAEAVEFASYDDEDEWAHIVEASVHRDDLWSRFQEALKAFPHDACLDIVVHAHWKEFGTTTYMRCPDEWTRADMQRFLQENYTATVLNGHIGIAFVAKSPDSLLKLTEHKTICCATDDTDVANSFADTLLDLPLVEECGLRCLASGYTHMHYAWPGTPERADFMRLLYKHGFTLLNQADETYSDRSNSDDANLSDDE